MARQLNKAIKKAPTCPNNNRLYLILSTLCLNNKYNIIVFASAMIMKKKNICLLGSTGSIGKNTLEVIKKNNNFFNIKSLASFGNNLSLVKNQINEFNPSIVCIFDESNAAKLKYQIPSYKTKIISGLNGLKEIVSMDDIDLVISAISGKAGVIPTIEAIKNKKDVALANKEVLVSAGDYIKKLVKEHKTKIIPIDSEHNAIFQIIENKKKEDIKKIILTASGGPFYNLKNFNNITPKQALNHPTWSMGPKNSIDSSTLMNKGLEVIEAHFLFSIPFEQIDVLIHPQSLVHGLVEFIDGSTILQMSTTDMKIPIQNAISHPYKIKNKFKNFNFTESFNLTFSPPDLKNFICLELAYDALKKGKSLPCFMNAANEILVQRFLQNKISWLEIGYKLEKLMTSHSIQNMLCLKDILEVEEEAIGKAKII